MTLPVEGLDDQERRVVENVEKHGSHVFCISPTPGLDDGFSFTIGLLHNDDHPELIVFGQKSEWQHSLLNSLRNEIQAGRRFGPGDTCGDVLENFTLVFRPVPKEQLAEHFGWMLWFYWNLDRAHWPPSALQVVWPDLKGHLPWEPGYHNAYRQPVLDGTPVVEPRNAFPVDLDAMVFVCSRVNEGVGVLFVSHDDDDGWQFLCGGDHDADALVASGETVHRYCIRHLIEADATLNDVANLAMAESASRDERGGAWTREHVSE